jgi:regulatory protein
MKITSISVQAKNKDRVNVSVDGKYAFSLDFYQVTELGVKVGQEYDEESLHALLDASAFGKLYGRALEYCFMRPHSAREVRDYLYRKTRPTRNKDGSERPGVSQTLTERVFERLNEKGYIDDEKFTRYWVENRSMTKGVSKRKLNNELRTKGVSSNVIDQALAVTERSDEDELQKIIFKKKARYPDEQKFMAYLVRQGFSYDDVKQALNKNS